MKQKESELTEAWNREKSINEDIKKKKKELEKLRFELDQAENKYDLERAAILRHGEIPKAEKELEALNKVEKNKLLSDTVTENDICKIIAKWTNIPVTKLLESEKEKLLSLEEDMKKRVMGQEEALKIVSDAIIKSRSGIKDPNRPIASFMFLGPTGVGKTEIARTLAYELFDDERHMVRIDMSEYMEKFSVSRLIGSPPGYVGYEEGGQLTEAVRRNPYSIVLFDEIEKAHPEVLNLLLQILDDGRVTDSNGRTVDFKNTIIIMTSNLGSEYVLDNQKDLVMKEVRNHFRPEFINRIDEIIIFNTLSKEAINQILDKIIREIETRLKNIDLHIELTDIAREKFIEEGYDVTFGARPLKRLVGKTLEVDLSKMLIEGAKEINKPADEKIKKLFSYKEVLYFGFATAIDALGTGVALHSGLSNNITIWLHVAIIMVITFIISLIGLFLGNQIEKLLKGKHEITSIIGGSILIILAVWIVLSHYIGI